MTEKKNKKYVYNFSIFKIDKIFEKYLLVDGKVDRLVGKVGRVEPCRVGRYVGRVGKWACKDGMVVDEGVGNNPSNVFWKVKNNFKLCKTYIVLEKWHPELIDYYYQVDLKGTYILQKILINSFTHWTANLEKK